MAYKCEICGKKRHSGGQHTHAKGVAGGQWKKRAPHTKRVISPNLHYVTLPVNGKPTRMRVCTKCIKRVKFNIKKHEEEKAKNKELIVKKPVEKTIEKKKKIIKTAPKKKDVKEN